MKIDNLKKWMKKKELDNLSDLAQYVIEHPKKSYVISDYIDQMEINRESLDELEMCISSWDIYELMSGLLTRFLGVMTKDEIEEYVCLYKRTFDIPLNEWIVDEIEHELSRKKRQQNICYEKELLDQLVSDLKIATTRLESILSDMLKESQRGVVPSENNVESFNKELCVLHEKYSSVQKLLLQRFCEIMKYRIEISKV